MTGILWFELLSWCQIGMCLRNVFPGNSRLSGLWCDDGLTMIRIVMHQSFSSDKLSVMTDKLKNSNVFVTCFYKYWVKLNKFTCPTMHQSHNAPYCNRNVHMRAHFCYKMVHRGIFFWCIAGFVRWVYWKISLQNNSFHYSYMSYIYLPPLRWSTFRSISLNDSQFVSLV